jgi:non-heme chloroperoxidase
MGMVTTSDGVEIFFKDWGSGQPLVFSHGWPLSSDDWDNQMLFFLSHGYRVVAHDRRGHGRSTQTGDGHDMDHYADDLAAVTEHLDLRDAAPGQHIETSPQELNHGHRALDRAEPAGGYLPRDRAHPTAPQDGGGTDGSGR